MTDSINKFMQGLTEKKALLETMLVFLQEEQKSVVNLDAESVEKHTEKKKDLMAKLEMSAISCHKQLRVVAKELLLPQAETISEILPALSPSLRAMLQQLQKQLQSLSEKVNRQLSLNRELLDNSLHLVNNSLQFFNNLLTKRPTYGNQGRMNEGGSGIRLINREA